MGLVFSRLAGLNLGWGWWWKGVLALEIMLKFGICKSAVIWRIIQYLMYLMFTVENECSAQLFLPVWVVQELTQRRWHDGSCPEVKWDDGLWWKNDVVMPLFAHISYSFPFIEEDQSKFLFLRVFFFVFSFHTNLLSFFLKLHCNDLQFSWLKLYFAIL